MEKIDNTKKYLNLIAVVGGISFIWFFIANFIGAIVISGFSRPIQGESVSIPWSICVLTVFLLELLPVTLLACLRIKDKWLKIVAIATIFIMFFIANYLLGDVELLNKAWRRGL